jgi:GNAT superfamily N-acetyltransferase
VESWRAAYRDQLPSEILKGLDADKRGQAWSGILADPAVDTFVAESDSEIVGFSSLCPSRDADANSTTAEISSIYLLESAWTQGIGTALFSRMLSRASERNYEEVTLWVLRTNARARGFYDRVGLRLDGAEKHERSSTGAELDEIRYRGAVTLHAV